MFLTASVGRAALLHCCIVHAFCKRYRETLFIPNLIIRYSIGDRTKGVQKNTEGGLTNAIRRRWTGQAPPHWRYLSEMVPEAF